MKTVVCVVVHDRFENVKRWVECWKQLSSDDKENSELVIVHNASTENLVTRFRDFCKLSGIKYLSRNNTGFDTGVLQDIARARLKGFPDFDNLLFCTDDVFPIQKNFICAFTEPLRKFNVVITAMEISGETKPHIRTNGFCVTKEFLETVTFPVDTVATKEQCYLFEHKSPDAFLEQVHKAGFNALQVAPVEKSPLWDSGYNGRARKSRASRISELTTVFNFPKPKVAIVCPAFERFPEIISAMVCQTYRDWELLLIHNGPESGYIKKILTAINDDRIKFIETETNTGTWGHVNRKWALDEIKAGRMAKDAEYVLITNDDNYHVPGALDLYLRTFAEKPHVVAVYCGGIVHNYWAVDPARGGNRGTGWESRKTDLRKGDIDCAAVMVRKDVACQVGWQQPEIEASDWTYFSNILNLYPADKYWAKVEGNLLVHN